MTKKKPKTPTRKGFPIWSAILLAVAVIIIIVVVTQLSKPAETSMPLEVSVDEASTLYDEGAYFLDVREQSEWDQFHIPGTTLIPLGELQARLAEVPQDRKIVVVCRSGNRSAQGRDILLRAGYKNVTSMAGGVTQWKNDGLPTVTGP